jgi:hypothetical protein
MEVMAKGRNSCVARLSLLCPYTCPCQNPGMGFLLPAEFILLKFIPAAALYRHDIQGSAQCRYSIKQEKHS